MMAVSPEERRLAEATGKALDEARHDNLPTRLRSHATSFATLALWRVGSRTRTGVKYHVTLQATADGIVTECACEAGEHGRLCWHRRAVELATMGELDWYDGPVLIRATRPQEPAPEPVCQECGQVGQRVLNGRCSDCWQVLLFGSAS